MLVLSRKLGERIIIDQDIHLTVLAIHGNQVRLGFTAPPEVTIHREEILRRGMHSSREGQICCEFVASHE